MHREKVTDGGAAGSGRVAGAGFGQSGGWSEPGAMCHHQSFRLAGKGVGRVAAVAVAALSQEILCTGQAGVDGLAGARARGPSHGSGVLFSELVWFTSLDSIANPNMNIRPSYQQSDSFVDAVPTQHCC